MSDAPGPNWPLLFLALLCLLPAVWGALWAFGGEDGQQTLGLAVLGFFGAGVVVLALKALRP
ncbi:hypothetical protein [Nocardioides dongkuii]|uniref:hypothetical protein n=1 Tax=Nocardioides dongkuii TaxID=2760089 RepID=UPI0015FC5A58|nr:hypothetical protein [Nocardioides dongkuii]